jgi:AMP phosphorylase
LTAVLLEMTGRVHRGEGRAHADGILQSGKAREKMLEIIEAQGGDPNIKPEDIPLGDHVYNISSTTKGKVRFMDNRLISRVARAAGAPKNKEAGVYLHVGVGDSVDKDDKLFTIYSIHESKLSDAIQLAEQLEPVKVGGHVLEEVI